MGVEFSIFDRAFLERVLEQNLGDWTNADELSEGARARAVELAEAAGFALPELPPDRLESLRKRGIERTQWELDDGTHLAMMELFPGQIAFTVPFSEAREASFAVCHEIAEQLINAFDLAIYEP